MGPSTRSDYLFHCRRMVWKMTSALGRRKLLEENGCNTEAVHTNMMMTRATQKEDLKATTSVPKLLHLCGWFRVLNESLIFLSVSLSVCLSLLLR